MIIEYVLVLFYLLITKDGDMTRVSFVYACDASRLVAEEIINKTRQTDDNIQIRLVHILRRGSANLTMLFCTRIPICMFGLDER